MKNISARQGPKGDAGAERCRLGRQERSSAELSGSLAGLLVGPSRTAMGQRLQAEATWRAAFSVADDAAAMARSLL